MSFNPMDCRLAMQLVPKRLPFRSSWIMHIPFAYALIERARPRTLVELGTHKGVSYLAFCQAVARLQLETKCTAIDTWQGDPHAGFYGGDVLDQLRKTHDREGYAAFSTLLQSTFDDALPKFADDSIDILHIDGLHTYEAVKHDFESWLPKLNRQTAVVLLHDSRVRTVDFGVWKLWEEISARYRHFEFEDGPGLAVALIGNDPPPSLAALFDSFEQSPDDVRLFFSTMAQSISRLQASRALIKAANLVITGVLDYRRGKGESLAAAPKIDELFADPETAANTLVQTVGELISKIG